MNDGCFDDRRSALFVSWPGRTRGAGLLGTVNKEETSPVDKQKICSCKMRVFSVWFGAQVVVMLACSSELKSDVKHGFSD